MDEIVRGSKIYLQPRGMLFDVVYDMAELQKGRKMVTDSKNDLLRYTVSMYGRKWELRHTLKDIGKGRCKVTLEIAGELSRKKRQLYFQFALLDAMLIGHTQMELEEQEQPADQAAI